MMNAGAYGGEMKHVLESADVLTPEGEFDLILKNWNWVTEQVLWRQKGIQFWAQRSHSKKAILRKSKRIWMT